MSYCQSGWTTHSLKTDIFCQCVSSDGAAEDFLQPVAQKCSAEQPSYSYPCRAWLSRQLLAAGTGSGYFRVFAKFGQPPSWRYGEWDFRPRWDYEDDSDVEVTFDQRMEGFQTGTALTFAVMVGGISSHSQCDTDVRGGQFGLIQLRLERYCLKSVLVNGRDDQRLNTFSN